MSSTRRYPKAPITEAIIDFQITLCPDEKLSTLQLLHEAEQKTYPQKDRIFETHALMEFQPDLSPTTTAQQKQTGFKFTSFDGKGVWQARLNGFTFSRLAPYDRWEPFRDETRRLWTACRSAIQPTQVTRLAVRYINRIDIPHTFIDLKQYFRTSPEIAPDLPQTLEGFFLQLRLPQEDLKGQLLINETIIPPSQPGVVSVVLDIDLFRQLDIPQDEDNIWAFFETLHTRKNEVFEASITDRTRELFQ